MVCKYCFSSQMELKGDITSLCFVLEEIKAKCSFARNKLLAFNSLYLLLSPHLLKNYSSTPNLYTVVCVYTSPGLSTTEGKCALLGLSGKCCASKQMALRLGKVAP